MLVPYLDPTMKRGIALGADHEAAEPISVDPPQWSRVTRRVSGNYLLGIAAMASGAGVITYILARISLLGGFGLAVLVQIVAFVTVWSQASLIERGRLSRIASAGLLSGVLATSIYDLTKFALSHLDATVYDPFQAIRMFGIALLGPSASAISGYSVGAAYHTFNGVMFGVGFAFLLGRRGVLAGIAWGFFLEAFQLALFPGWLHIEAFQEFARVSALSHLAYGAVLGLLCKQWLGGTLGLSGSHPGTGGIKA